MSIEENKELIRQYYKDWNEVRGDVNKFVVNGQKYIAPNYVYHSVNGDMSREQAEKQGSSFITALPDMNLSIDDTVAEGDKVVTRYTMQCTHKGTFMGIAATGKKVVVKGVLISRIAGGKILEDWEIIDNLGLMTQLGTIPSPTAPKK